MEVSKLLKNVNTLNKYIAVTQDISNKYINAKIQFNMSSVLSLKKIRSLEIEYFNKSEDNGAACIIFERMLNTPPSKTWNILGKELVHLLQYWLDAVRKHLINHSIHWWTFLKLLLRFIKDIRTKDSSIPNILVELLAECLLDVATNDRPDPSQRRDVLACLNIFCAESGREIRFAMRNKFGNYFVKLSWYMCTCGHVPCQYSALETLVRWLLPRHEPAVRLAAADKWLPLHLCKDVARDVFLKRPWMDFFQDARAFLNAHNNTGNLITSVVIRKMTIGPITVITGTEKRETWLDINTAQNCISVLLEVKVLETIGVMIETSCEALVISCDDVDNAQLSRESPEVIISLRVLHTPCMTSSFKFPDDNDDKRDVTIVISSRCDLKNVDKALRGTFGDKYQLLLDLDKELTLSPEYTRNLNESGEDSRLSHPAEIRRRKHSGYIVGSRNPGAWRSPSTASTSSLAQLHEKLAALPRYRFEKEQVSVCVKPELSSVTELSETDDKHSLNTTSTLKLRPYGVCYKGLNTKVDSNRKSQSDSEGVKHKSKTRNLSPVVNESAASCLLVATIGSDESVINETLERLGKNKDYNTDNIVDLLVQEALYSKQIQEKDKLLDSGINTGENRKTQELQRIVEEIDNTPCEDITTKAHKVPCTVISRSTSDESNTEVVNETPDYVSVRRKPVKPKPKQPETKKKTDCTNEITFDINAVEDFFSQHFTENKAGEIAVSPTLAKKINETSSESSDFEDHYLIINDNFNTTVENIETVNDIDIIECLNTMVDSVCNDFDKCTEYLNQENDEMRTRNANEKLLQEVTNTVEVKSNETARTPKKGIKLKYKVVRKKDNPKQKATLKKRKKVEKSKMSTIMEDNEVSTVMNTNNEACEIEPERKIATPDNKDTEARLMRRKRKLYSPKDADNKIDAENQITHIPMMKIDESKNYEEMPLSEVKRITRNKTPKSSATCYKEIETERRNRVRQPRKRISNSKIPSPPSPKTHKMNTLFDKLKETVESSEKIIIADKMMGNDVYNFTSESEDEDFKKKTIITKRNSTTTVGSLDSIISTRQGRGKRVNYSENISSNDDNKVSKKKAPTRRKKVVKRRNSKNKINIEPEIELVDERMRQAVQEELNTSLITEKRKQSIDKEPELVLETAPEMEIIADKEKTTKKRTNKKNKKTALDLIKIQKEHASKKADIEIMSNNEDGTMSPLPGLVVESVPLRQDDEHCSITANMLQKYKKIYQEGTDACINESNTTQNLLSDIERINVSTNKNVISEIDLNVDENFENIQTIDRTDKERMETDSTNSGVKSVKTYKPIKSLKLKNIDRNVKQTETIHINDNSEAKRRSVSITTVGITGHGELDESPPNVNLLHEKLKPRNLSIDDFDQSMKDYYVELTNEINKCSDMINVAEAPEIEPNINSDSIQSPVVSIQRLSLDDISKWLPSRRNSDSDQTSSIDHNSSKAISQSNSKTAKVMVKNKSKSSNEYKIIKLKRANVRNITSNETTQSSSADKNASGKIMDIESIQTRSKKRIVDSKVNRKSMISPIKLFDDCQPNLNMKSDSSDNEYVKNIRKIFTKNKYTKRSESTKKYSLENVEIRDQESCSSLVSKVSTPTKVYGPSKCGLKRQSSPIRIEVKKKKTNVDAEEIAVRSVPSTSTVNDWLKRNEPTGSRAERINVSFNDSIQNILEKLDTTLVEIQQNTSKQFVHMFVEAQNYLSQMKENRRSMYKQVATDVMKEMVKVMDNKFADLDRRSQEMDSDFMSQLKERATEFIREDSKRKHAMVLLLREDVQSVIDHINKERRLDSP